MVSHPDLLTFYEAGLLLQAVLPVETLGENVYQPLRDAGVLVDEYKTLVLLGQAGSALWDRLVSDNLALSDPFDEVVIGLIERFFSGQHPGHRWQLAYPGPIALPLGQLAQQAGWGQPSPLGLTIHPEYGLWIAHRAAFLTTLALPAAPAVKRDHPCDSCLDRPCQSACPVGAVSHERGFDVGGCGQHRAPVGSSCEFQCHARNACPVGEEFAYGGEQMRHHYGAGLASIRRWLGASESGSEEDQCSEED